MPPDSFQNKKPPIESFVSRGLAILLAIGIGGAAFAVFRMRERNVAVEIAAKELESFPEYGQVSAELNGLMAGGERGISKETGWRDRGAVFDGTILKLRPDYLIVHPDEVMVVFEENAPKSLNVVCRADGSVWLNGSAVKRGPRLMYAPAGLAPKW